MVTATKVVVAASAAATAAVLVVAREATALEEVMATEEVTAALLEVVTEMAVAPRTTKVAVTVQENFSKRRNRFKFI